jgi:hypothetical protein
VGGNLIDYPGVTRTPGADITTFKIHVNDVLSTPGAHCLNLDVSNFYLNTPMPEPEFMKIPIRRIPDEVIQEYKLTDLVDPDGNVWIRINKGMYGPPQAGKLAFDLLQSRLTPHGYYPCRHTPGLWRHQTRKISFVLVVDDFSIKYVGRDNAQHLLDILQAHYKTTEDWDASLYCGITVKWDFLNRTAELSMPGYVQAALDEYQHQAPRRAQHAPHRHQPKQYGAKSQLVDPPDESPPLDPAGRQYIQKVVGKLLYYGRAVDSTLLVALSSLASQQATATENTRTAIKHLLDYCATHPNATLKYHASDMHLKIHSDAGYNNETQGRSRAGGHFYLGDADTKPHVNNGAILNPTSIIRHVASSASEAETAATFINCKEAVTIRTTLQELGWPQPPTPVTQDNTTTLGIVNDTIKQQRTRAMDMRYYWLQDRAAQQQFHFRWRPSADNLADYFTKHHPPSHHQSVRTKYLVNCCLPHIASQINGRHQSLRGCADPDPIPEIECRPARHLPRHRNDPPQPLPLDAGRAGPTRPFPLRAGRATTPAKQSQQTTFARQIKLTI